MYTLKEYYEFLEQKIDLVEWSGFDVDPARLHPDDFPHQKDTIIHACKMGRLLIAKRFGLGKTTDQCEIGRMVHEHTGKSFLVICPLGAKYMFQEEDGPRLGMNFEYVRNDEEVWSAKTPYLVTNYERVRDGGIDPRNHDFGGVSLDEGDVIRNLDTKTFHVFMDAFKDVPYKFIATATPDPNTYRELIYFAHWLGVMDYGQALNKFFQRNPNKAGDLQLHPQHEEKFWLWVASWAVFLYEPADLGYSNEGYEMPEIKFHWHRLPVDHTRSWEQTDSKGQHRLFLDAAAGVSEMASERRETMSDRIDKMVEIVTNDEPDKNWLLWHFLEDERRAIEQAIPEVVSVYGRQSVEDKEDRITRFGRGEFRFLATKPEIAGSGPNFQHHCADAIFVGPSYKFKDVLQAIHRIYRYMQKKTVNIHFIYAESEQKIVDNFLEKFDRYNQQQETMRVIVKEYGLSHNALTGRLKRSMTEKRRQVKGDFFTAINNDSVIEMFELADNSMDMWLTSIPFGNHYEFTELYNDFGHNTTDEDFWKQMDFLIPQAFRTLKPGRVFPVHVKDRILYGHQTKSGFMEVEEFSDDCVKAFRKHGFLYEGRRTIVTDVVRENNSTYRLGWSEMCKDATKMGSGLPEYVLLFRKPPTDRTNAYADEKVIKDKNSRFIYICTECGYELTEQDEGLEITTSGDKFLGENEARALCPQCEQEAIFSVGHTATFSLARWQIDAHAFWRSSGNRSLTPDEIYDYEDHVARLEEKEKNGNLPKTFFYEPPVSTSAYVWDDVNFMMCLNAKQRQKRRQNHICPFPYDIVERLIRLYSNPGDLIGDMFAGLFTVPMKAVELGRRAWGGELNEEYFDVGVQYTQAAEIQAKSPTLFDLAKFEEVEQVK